MAKIQELPSLSPLILSASREELLHLLNNAKVTVGHLNGRRIQFSGYQGQLTFSELARQVENHYQATLEPMQIRQKQYRDATEPKVSQRGPLLVWLASIPIAMASSVIRTAITPEPEVSPEEEKKIASVLKWRANVDKKFDDLFTQSQKELDTWASKSWIGTTIRAWDSFLDSRRALRNVHSEDGESFQRMVKARVTRVAIESSVKPISQIESEARNVFTDFLIWCKFRKQT